MTATDADALLATIRVAPDDDAPRLVYADWLDEHGEGERAEFIRVQCELARRDDSGDTGEVDPNEGHTCFEDPCQVCKVAAEYAKLSDRAGRLFMAHGREWFGFPRGGGHIAAITDTRWVGVEQTWFVRRGFVHTIHVPLAALLGGECGRCEGLKRGDLVEAVPGNALVCGSGRYSHAVVVSINPFALVSVAGDMLWASTQRAHTVRKVGTAESPELAFRRWDRDRRGYTNEQLDGYDCPACRGTGRTPGLRDLVRREPVEAVRVTDRDPEHVEDEADPYFQWLSSGQGWREANEYIPGSVYKWLPRGQRNRFRWQTRAAAHAALGRAVLAHLRADG